MGLYMKKLKIALQYKCKDCSELFLRTYDFLPSLKNSERNHACEGESKFFGNTDNFLEYICNKCASSFQYDMFKIPEMKNARIVSCDICGGTAEYMPDARINPFGSFKK